MPVTHTITQLLLQFSVLNLRPSISGHFYGTFVFDMFWHCYFFGINISWRWYSWSIRNAVNAPYLHDNQNVAQITGGHAGGAKSGGPIRVGAIGGLSHFWTHMFFCGCNRFCLAVSDFLTAGGCVQPQCFCPATNGYFVYCRWFCSVASVVIWPQALFFGNMCSLEKLHADYNNTGGRSCVQIRWTSSS